MHDRSRRSNKSRTYEDPALEVGRMSLQFRLDATRVYRDRDDPLVGVPFRDLTGKDGIALPVSAGEISLLHMTQQTG